MKKQLVKKAAALFCVLLFVACACTGCAGGDKVAKKMDVIVDFSAEYDIKSGNSLVTISMETAHTSNRVAKTLAYTVIYTLRDETQLVKTYRYSDEDGVFDHVEELVLRDIIEGDVVDVTVQPSRLEHKSSTIGWIAALAVVAAVGIITYAIIDNDVLIDAVEASTCAFLIAVALLIGLFFVFRVHPVPVDIVMIENEETTFEYEEEENVTTVTAQFLVSNYQKLHSFGYKVYFIPLSGDPIEEFYACQVDDCSDQFRVITKTWTVDGEIIDIRVEPIYNCYNKKCTVDATVTSHG